MDSFVDKAKTTLDQLRESKNKAKSTLYQLRESKNAAKANFHLRLRKKKEKIQHKIAYLVDTKSGNIKSIGGCLPSTNLDGLDSSFFKKEEKVDLPPMVDMRPFMTPVENQAHASNCTANAVVGGYEYLLARNKAKEEEQDVTDLSRLFVYYNARNRSYPATEKNYHHWVPATSGPSAKTEMSQLLGKRVHVWWPDHSRYFAGTITKKKECYFIEYDDGDAEWVNLEERDHIFLDIQDLQEGEQGSNFVGQRVEIWRDLGENSRYHAGLATRMKVCYFIEYDDGDTKWANIMEEYSIYVNENKGILFNSEDFRLVPNPNDSGVSLSDALQALAEYGVCLEKTWDYVVGPDKQVLQLNTRPSARAYREAEELKQSPDFQWRMPQRIWPPTLDQLKQCLAEGCPIILGLALFDDFDVAKEYGRVPMPQENAASYSGVHAFHAMLCVGYKDSAQCFIVRNSWGPEWGDKGYCYIPYAYMTNPAYYTGESGCWKVRGPEGIDLSKDTWVLDDVPFGDGFYQDSPFSSKVFTIDEAMLALCFLGCKSDGISTEERECLSAWLVIYGIEETELHQSISDMAEYIGGKSNDNESSRLGKVEDAVCKIILANDMAEEAFAMSLQFAFYDGVISMEEKKFWSRVGNKLGIDADVATDIFQRLKDGNPTVTEIEGSPSFSAKYNGEVSATFRNTGDDPQLEKAVLYLEDTNWGDIGHGNPPITVERTYVGSRWFVKVGDTIVKQLVIGEEDVQEFTF